MGHHHIPLPFKIVSLFLLAASPVLGASGSLPDVLIQAEEKRPIQREKPPLEMKLKEDEVLDTVLKTEDELYTRIPTEVIQSTKYVTNIWQSHSVAVPATNWIVLTWKGEPAYVFHPKERLDEIYKDNSQKRTKNKNKEVEVGWEWLVVDAAGRVFRKYSGPGQPPARLNFDGKSDNEKWLKVGQVYQGILNYTDTAGRTHTAMGRPFALAGISLQKPDGYVISLAPRSMFDEAARGDLTPDGEKLLREATQLIQRHHAGLSLELDAYLSWGSEKTVVTAAENCVTELARDLLLPDKKIVVRAHPGSPDIDQRIELRIFNR